jgi:hypothetical protein
MSRDLNYIGMDVHKEAVVIAVLNGTGTQGMESIVETEASSILRFIDGLARGRVACDLGRRQLGHMALRFAQTDLLRAAMLRPVYHGEHGPRTLPVERERTPQIG